MECITWIVCPEPAKSNAIVHPFGLCRVERCEIVTHTPLICISADGDRLLRVGFGRLLTPTAAVDARVRYLLQRLVRGVSLDCLCEPLPDRFVAWSVTPGEPNAVVQSQLTHLQELAVTGPETGGFLPTTLPAGGPVVWRLPSELVSDRIARAAIGVFDAARGAT